MRRKIYKSGSQIVVDPPMKEESKHTSPLRGRFGFIGDNCWIRNSKNHIRYTLFDKVSNLTDSEGTLIGDKEDVRAYLKSIMGDPGNTDSELINWGLSFLGTDTQRSEGVLVNDPSGAHAILEFRYKWFSGASSGHLMASLNLSTNASASNFGLSFIRSSTVELRVKVGTGSSNRSSYTPIASDNDWHTYKGEVWADGSFQVSIDDVAGGVAGPAASLSSSPSLYLGSNGIGVGPEGVMDWAKVTVNGIEEIFNINEAIGNKVIGSLGTVIDLDNPVWERI